MAMEVRLSKKEDLFHVVRLLKESAEYAGYTTDNKKGMAFHFEYDEANAIRLFNFMHEMSYNVCLCLVDEEDIPRGILMAGWTRHPFGEVRVAKETVIFITEEYRGSVKNLLELLKAGIDWAVVEGCDYIAYSEHVHSPIAAIYRRLGFEPVETVYLKSLKG